MASVMTGSYSSGHGLQLSMHRLRSEAVTIAEVLSGNGYQTGAVIGSFPLDSVYHLDQGFETYDDNFSLPIVEMPGKPIFETRSHLDENLEEQTAFLREKLVNDAYRPDEDVTSAALQWIDHVRDGRPFFLWVHYFGPHERINASDPISEQEPDIIAAYDGDVETTDRAVGRLLAKFRDDELLDSSVVVYHSDHGQSLGEHGYVGHGMDLYDVSTRIPLLLRYPTRLPAGTRRSEIARNIDIRPTVFDLLDVQDPRPGMGRSLIQKRPPGTSGTVAYFETYLSTLFSQMLDVRGQGKVRAQIARQGLRGESSKLIVSRVVGPCQTGTQVRRETGGGYLFTDGNDVPEERCLAMSRKELYRADSQENPDDDESTVRSALVESLESTLWSLRTDRPELREEFVLSPEQEAKLRSLGYL